MLSRRSLDSGRISADSTVLDDRDELLHQASRLITDPPNPKGVGSSAMFDCHAATGRGVGFVPSNRGADPIGVMHRASPR